MPSDITKLNRYGQQPYPFAAKCAAAYCTKSAGYTCRNCSGRFCPDHILDPDHDCPERSEVTVDEAVQRG